MIPIRDEIKARRVPVVNTLLIIVNVIVFCLQWLLASEQSEAILYQFAFVPYNFLMAPIKFSNLRNIFTAMFMHAGLLHLGGNMLYLWIFGDNVEDAWGHLGYLMFYLVGGVTATLVHTITNPLSVVPTVGASGAIAAVLGAYLVLYPHSRVLTFIPWGIYDAQGCPSHNCAWNGSFCNFSAVCSPGWARCRGSAWAHIGGFVTGVLLAILFKNAAIKPHSSNAGSNSPLIKRGGKSICFNII